MGKKRKTDVSDAQIIQHYQSSHSIFVTAKILGIGSTTALRVLTKYGIPRIGLAEFRKKITRFKGEESKIREAYDQGLTIDQLRQKFGTASDYAYRNAIRRAGGVFRQNPAPLIKDGELEKIKELNASGLGQVAISLALNRSQSFISRAMRRNGINTHFSRAPLTRCGKVAD